MDASTREVREEQWAQLILECNQSGLSRREFCQRKNINEKTFYYRQRTIRLKLTAQRAECRSAISLAAGENTPMRFAELALPSQTKYENEGLVSVQVNGLAITLPENVSESFLVKLLRAACHAG